MASSNSVAKSVTLDESPDDLNDDFPLDGKPVVPEVAPLQLSLAGLGEGIRAGCDAQIEAISPTRPTMPLERHPADYPPGKYPIAVESDNPSRIDLTKAPELAKWQREAKVYVPIAEPRLTGVAYTEMKAWAESLRISADTFARERALRPGNLLITDVIHDLQDKAPAPPACITIRKRARVYGKIARRAIAKATPGPTLLSHRELTDRLIVPACGRALHHRTRGWMTNNGRIWYAGSAAIKEIVRKVLIVAAHESDAMVKPAYTATALNSAGMDASIMKLAEEVLAMPAGREFDEDHFLLNTPNGIVDLRTGATRPTPSFTEMSASYFSRCTSVAPASSARCPLWLDFLGTTFSAKKDVISFIQRWFGYCLTGSTLAQTVLLFHGTGNNGKSILMETVALIAANYAMSASPSTFIEPKYQRSGSAPTPDISRFEGVRYLRVPEVKDEAVLNMALIKTMTGGEEISARLLYKNVSEFRPLLKMVLSLNLPPNLKAVDKGTTRRLVLVPFNNTIPDPQVDRNLLDKLKAEHSGILRWLIDGAVAYHKIGLAPPDEILEATKTWLESESGLLDWIHDCCDLGPQSSATQAALWQNYNAWRVQQGLDKVAQKRLSADFDTAPIKELGIEKRQGARRSASRAVYYTGIQIKPSVVKDVVQV